MCFILTCNFFIIWMNSLFASSVLLLFFLFKQKTAYGMRISDWSSDVCSSDRLDANTELHVGYRWWRRNVDVVRGQASFDVAHDAQRPFIVTAGGGIVTARGTRFNVNLMRDGFVVTLMQGKVDVASSKTDARNKLAFLVQLSPGEQLAVHVGDRPVLRHVDVRDATAWQQHRIVFHDVTLGEAAEQLNRYDT